MPNWFPSWTKCCDPANYRGLPLGAMIAIGSLGVIMGGTTIFAAIAPGVAVILAALCLPAMALCTWWLNVRLICLGGDRSAIGAIYYLEPPVQSSNPFNFKANFENADTDYSFNLLLWQFTPKNSLPLSFVSTQWSPGAFAQLGTDWPTLPPLVPNVPFSEVSDEVNLIVPQQSMASLGLGFGGQNIETSDKPIPPATDQHFLLHCEIEGPGMHDLLILLGVMFAIFVAAALVYAIPAVGPILSWILIALALLAFLIGSPAITHSDASPPSGGGWGGSVNPFQPAPANQEAPVDLIYVFGRWVYDSFHEAKESNELHPLHYMIKMKLPAKQGDLSIGIWPSGLGEIQQKYDAQFGVINSPTTIEIQKQPQNQWTVHPLLDGCLGGTPYPEPLPPGLV